MATIKTGELRAKDGSGNEYVLVPNHKGAGDNSTAIGILANAPANYSTALGYNAQIEAGEYTIAIGAKARTTGSKSIAMGAIAIGGNAYTAYSDSMALGHNACAFFYKSIAVGPYARASNDSSISVGYYANSTSKNSIAIGNSAKTTGDCAIAIGNGAYVTNNHSIALGFDTCVADNNGIVIGYNAKINSQAVTKTDPGYGSIGIGYNVCVNASTSIAIGYGASVFSTDEYANNLPLWALAIGLNAHAGGYSSVAIGKNANGGWLGTAIGSDSKTRCNFALAVGHYANANGYYATAIGYGTNCQAASSTAIGSAAKVESSAPNTIRLGSTDLSSLRCAVSLTVTSDERDKADISMVDNGAIAFLNKIRAIRYHRNPREIYIDNEHLSEDEQKKYDMYGMCEYDKESHSIGTKKGSRMRVGVSAQEVQKALIDVYGSSDYANIVDDNLHDIENIPKDVENKLCVNYEAFIPFLIKAIQELSSRINVLEGPSNV